MLTVASLFSFAPGWEGISDVVAPSLQRVLDGEGGVCAGSIVNKKAGFVLTANHCLPENANSVMTSNGRVATVIEADKKTDLLMLYVFGLRGEQIQVRRESVSVGTPVALVGYAFGGNRPKYTFGFVSDLKDSTGDGPIKFDEMYLDISVVKGQSGGAVVDEQGRLIAVVNGFRSDDVGNHLTLVTPHDVLLEFLEPYLP